MINIFLFGCSGKMGKYIIDCAAANNAKVVGGFDAFKSDAVPTFTDVNEVNMPFDVIVDFTRPETLDCVISLAKKTRRPVVLCTTGYSKSQEEQILNLSKEVAVLRSGNMSTGINLLLDLVAKAAKTLGTSFDVEITETHHNQKVDAPSGTAKMLADSVKKMQPQATYVYGREGAAAKRQSGEIGIHALRGGTVVGEHSVMFYGDDEVITISHSASSRKIFANGALRAANFLSSASPALYSMKDVLKD